MPTTFQFQSQAQGQNVTWVGRDCLNRGRGWYARFKESSSSQDKDGTFELAPWVQSLFMDEVVISGIAAMEFRRKVREG